MTNSRRNPYIRARARLRAFWNLEIAIFTRDRRMQINTSTKRARLVGIFSGVRDNYTKDDNHNWFCLFWLSIMHIRGSWITERRRRRRATRRPLRALPSNPQWKSIQRPQNVKSLYDTRLVQSHATATKGSGDRQAIVCASLGVAGCIFQM